MWARRILGLLLVAMGIGKLTDVAGYAHALAAFRVIPVAALPAVAWIWPCAELVAGALLLAGGRLARPGVQRVGAGEERRRRRAAIHAATAIGIATRLKRSPTVNERGR
ncbi:MAG TPA: MauE/DoxX family redox-associated membrane protein [Polyangia bacterium]